MSFLAWSQLGLWILAVVNLLLILVLYRQFGLAAISTAEGHDDDGIPVGTEPPPLVVGGVGLEDPEANITDLDISGRWGVVMFSSPMCEPCIEAMDGLHSRYTDFVAHGIRSMVVLVGEEEAATELIRTKGYQMEFYCDPAGTTGASWGVKVTPFAFVISPDGIVRGKRLVGSRQRLEEFLDQVAQLVSELADSGADKHPTK